MAHPASPSAEVPLAVQEGVASRIQLPQPLINPLGAFRQGWEYEAGCVPLTELSGARGIKAIAADMTTDDRPGIRLSLLLGKDRYYEGQYHLLVHHIVENEAALIVNLSIPEDAVPAALVKDQPLGRQDAFQRFTTYTKGKLTGAQMAKYSVERLLGLEAVSRRRALR